MALYEKCVRILRSRGKTFDDRIDFLVQDNMDGNGPFIAHWDAVKLDAVPTQGELDATDGSDLVPTDEELYDDIQDIKRFMKAFVKAYAQREGLKPAQVKAAILAQM